MKRVTIYTDGACEPNPGRGGWAAVLTCDGRHRTVSGTVEDTTNNRMEVCAIVEGLRALTRPCAVRVVSDSQYAVRCADGTWRINANRDLFTELRAAEQPHDVTYEWVRGHSGHPGNEQAHAAAYAAATSVPA